MSQIITYEMCFRTKNLYGAQSFQISRENTKNFVKKSFFSYNVKLNNDSTKNLLLILTYLKNNKKYKIVITVVISLTSQATTFEIT